MTFVPARVGARFVWPLRFYDAPLIEYNFPRDRQNFSRTAIVVVRQSNGTFYNALGMPSTRFRNYCFLRSTIRYLFQFYVCVPRSVRACTQTAHDCAEPRNVRRRSLRIRRRTNTRRRPEGPVDINAGNNTIKNRNRADDVLLLRNNGGAVFSSGAEMRFKYVYNTRTKRQNMFRNTHVKIRNGRQNV